MSNTPQYWLYTPGAHGFKWQDCKSNGLICIGWDILGDLSRFKSIEEIDKMLSDCSHRRLPEDSLINWQFAHEIKPGDIIIAKRGRNHILGMGVVESSYSFDNSRTDYKSIIPVRWTDTGEWNTDAIAPVGTLTNITTFTSLVDIYISLIKYNLILPNSVHYWWFCSNSRTWNMGEWHVGEKKYYDIYTESGNPRPVYENFKAARPGDVVLCYDGVNSKALVGLAVVSKKSDTEAIGFEKVESFSNMVALSTLKTFELLKDCEFFAHHELSGFYKLTAEQYSFLQDYIREQNPTSTESIVSPYTSEDFMKDVYISEKELGNMISVLKNKKNIILQGAPGVGKTFSARRLAYCMMGEKADSRIALVQFHQNYSYEDFVMGYKPCGSDFLLQKGVFYRFCVAAANNPDQDYFFIIDEINRGNLSKIFGELLMLIEKDYRGDRLTLAYSDERFFVPDNLYILGMMNTADRSLAMMDYALRRRFGFISLKPGFDSAGFIKYQSSLNSTKFNKLINAIKMLNSVIVSDKSLGEGFEIGHSYFCGQDKVTDEWLNQIVNYDIIPMLTEYWFDNKPEIDRWRTVLVDAING